MTFIYYKLRVPRKQRFIESRPRGALFPDITVLVLIHSSGAAEGILNKAVFHQVKESN